MRRTTIPPGFSRRDARAVMRALAPHWGALLGLTLFLIAGLAVLDDYGVGGDESAQRQNAEANLRYLADGDFGAFTDFGSKGGLFIDHDKFYGMAFEAPLLLIERAFGIDDAPRAVNLSRHLHTRLLFLAGGLFAYLLALRLFGSRPLALLAMGFFLLHPRLYGHSLLNPKDIPLLAMFIVALYLAHRAFRRDGVAAFALLGAAVGILVNLRIMGVVLLAAVPAARALDFALASGWAERKRVLLTTGAFALASALAIYALLPYLWADPIPRAVEGWTTLSNHPHTISELFRGTVYGKADFPIEYLPVWFSITSPPFALLLGGVGAAAILAAAARAPRKALRSGRLRFGLLALGCFAAPVVAALMLDATQDGWRHMYFLWAPFSLLATFGLGALVSALGRRPLRTAVYGAAGAGLAATAVSMALVHPNQQLYFNALVDRVAPGLLGTQYKVSAWGHLKRQGLEWLAEHSAPTSGGASAVRAIDADWLLRENTLILPESARERLASAAPFDVVPSQPWGSWSRSAREMHRAELYGSAIMTVESLDAPVEVYDAVRGREPLIDGVFDVHRVDGALALVMEPCAPSFLRRNLIVRVSPVNADDVPAWRRGATEPRIFYLGLYGASFDGKCAASVPLPDYPIAAIDLSWRPELLSEADARAKARRAREEGRLLTRAAHRSAYDVYLADGELAYLNESCGPLETERPFHLNVFPEQVGDLPEERRERGFERFHFEFHLTGAFVDGGCAAFFPPPDYPVVAIQTGQRDGEGVDLWYAEFLIDPGRRWADAAAGASGEPVAHGAFDVHLADGALVYVKEPCGREDTDARFFLHITPEQASDLPNERRQYGFDNLDFGFFPNGALFAGRCAARVPLPDYPVSSVRTGQYISGVGEVWSAEFAVGE